MHSSLAFAPEGLELEPTLQVPAMEEFLIPKPGTIESQFIGEEHRQLSKEALARMSARVSERRASCRPVFKSFDRHNSGHVTLQQFKQVLTMLELHATQPEMDALAAIFVNDVGFNYRAFLDIIEPNPEPIYRFPEFLIGIRQLNARQRLPEKKPAENFEAVLEKVKTKVLLGSEYLNIVPFKQPLNLGLIFYISQVSDYIRLWIFGVSTFEI